MARGSVVSITIPVDVQSRLASHAARRTAATGRIVSAQQAARELVRFGLTAAEKCLSCSMSLPCDTHGSKDPEEDETPIEGFQSVVDTWHNEFTRARGEKPQFSAADFSAMKRFILGCGGADEAKRLIKKAFAVPFTASTITIQSLARNPQLAQGKAANEAQTPQQARSNWKPPTGKKAPK